jgi:hypothetical protein
LSKKISFLALYIFITFFFLLLPINNTFADLVSWDKLIYKIGDTALFGAIISDANTDPNSIQSILIHVSSDSDPIGRDVISFETENNSGIFVATIKFAAFTGSTTIKVSEGDSVYAKYGKLSDTTTIKVSKILANQKEEPPIIIPEWIKDIAEWWANDQIDDETFVEGIQFLISEGVIIVPPTESSNTGVIDIPVWIKNNAKWWSDGLISNEDFVKGIQYLVKNGIILV